MAHNDIREAEGTYTSFIGMVKIGSILTAAVVVLVVLLIS